MISISLLNRKFIIRGSHRSRVLLLLFIAFLVSYSTSLQRKSFLSLDLSILDHFKIGRFPKAKIVPGDEPLSKPEDNTEESLTYSDTSEYDIVRRRSETLPLHISIPFEPLVKDIKLEGWEDEWLSHGVFNATKWRKLKEPKIDLIYNWVNGSDQAFKNTVRQYEMRSKLNDPKGVWLSTHRRNRFTPWNELLYSLRSVDKYAGSFLNKVQILVNEVKLFHYDSFDVQQQRPDWLASEQAHNVKMEVLSQEDFFSNDVKGCLPAFNSRTIESMIFNTKSDTDHVFAMSDDMFLATSHAASDMYSPLFGVSMGFKNNSYSKLTTPNATDLARFGEKPGLIYTSWLLNQRFGDRKRSGQLHIGHSISRQITKEAFSSFPGPSLKTACTRFRNEDFQLNTWYLTFHYTLERFREALLWGYLLKHDLNADGGLDWEERNAIISEVNKGVKYLARHNDTRDKMYDEVPNLSKNAGLAPPKANAGSIIWTSLDGPYTTMKIKCSKFDIAKCMGKSFASAESKGKKITISSILRRMAKEKPKCGDCLIKTLLSSHRKGLSPLLPDRLKQTAKREIIIKALKKYQYMIVAPEVKFVMVSDAIQLERELDSLLTPQNAGGNHPTQICLNDDVKTGEKKEREKISQILLDAFEKLWPEKSRFEQK